MKELDEPMVEDVGVNLGKWFVYTIPETGVWDLWALLANGSNTLKAVPAFVTTDESAEFYFDTELDVYRSGYEYYRGYGKAFPYMKRLLELETQSGMGTGQSQTMEFI